jgi:TonB family protein
MTEEVDKLDSIEAEARRRCYETLAASEPSLTGTVVVGFMIRADGAVTEATVRSSTFARPNMERCVLDIVRATVFPPDDNDTWISLPIKFGPTPGG